MEYQTQHILGHEKIFLKLTALIRKKMLPNSIIFQGSKGIGKTTSAYRIAQFIFEQNDNPTESYQFINSDIYKKICNNAFPNLLFIQKIWLDDKKRYKSQIFRDDIKVIKDFYSNKDFGNQHRICIIDNIDDFSVDASNSLLKLIEEPPKNALFIIINHNKSKLLKTIESRSFVLKFNKLNLNDYSSLLKLNNYRYTEIDKLYQLNDADLQSSFNYIDNDLDTIDDHFTSLLVDRSKIKINTASHYVSFIKDNNTENIKSDLVNYMLLRIKKTILESIKKKNHSDISKLIKSYYFLDKTFKSQRIYNLNYDYMLINFFTFLRNA